MTKLEELKQELEAKLAASHEESKMYWENMASRPNDNL